VEYLKGLDDDNGYKKWNFATINTRNVSFFVNIFWQIKPIIFLFVFFHFSIFSLKVLLFICIYMSICFWFQHVIPLTAHPGVIPSLVCHIGESAPIRYRDLKPSHKSVNKWLKTVVSILF
jgi:hypothetical protein